MRKSQSNSFESFFNPLCSTCGQDLENDLHLYARCPFAYLVWYLSPLRLDVSLTDEPSFVKWWKELCYSWQKDDNTSNQAIAVSILCGIWKACYNFDFQGMPCDADHPIQMAVFKG